MGSSTSIAAPGTVGYEAIQWLRENRNATTTALAAAVNREAKSLPSILQPVLQADGIVRHKEASQWIWNVGPMADVLQSAGSTAPGEERTVLRASAIAAPSIFAYADQRHAAPFSTAVSTDGRMTIERHGRVIAELTDEERRVIVKAATHGVVPA